MEPLVFALLLMALTLGINLGLPKAGAGAETVQKAQPAQPAQPAEQAQVAHVAQVN